VTPFFFNGSANC